MLIQLKHDSRVFINKIDCDLQSSPQQLFYTYPGGQNGTFSFLLIAKVVVDGHLQYNGYNIENKILNIRHSIPKD